MKKSSSSGEEDSDAEQAHKYETNFDGEYREEVEDSGRPIFDEAAENELLRQQMRNLKQETEGAKDAVQQEVEHLKRQIEEAKRILETLQ